MNKQSTWTWDRRFGRRALAMGLAALFVSGIAPGQESGERYVVDPAQSDFHWLVYKAGAFSRFGHNHTIAVGDLSGNVLVNRDDLGKSQFDLQFAVGQLVVDDPALRATLGEDFSSVPKPDDIAGTRKNMLSERVLDGEKYPQIRVTGIGPTMAGGMQELAVKVEMLGRVIELNHADLGMQPFSVMAGALQVGEKLSFTYDVRAQRATR